MQPHQSPSCLLFVFVVKIKTVFTKCFLSIKMFGPPFFQKGTHTSDEWRRRKLLWKRWLRWNEDEDKVGVGDDDEDGDEDYDYNGDEMMTKMVRMMLTKMMTKMVQMMLMATKPVCRLWPKWLWLAYYLLHLTYYPSLCCSTVADNIYPTLLRRCIVFTAVGWRYLPIQW